ncbi:hypothetical protein DVJ77_20870 [Dyella tabacisoli]|uniref:KfrA N-terminal DNA-binding domain-containing protein n=1 Tax=Dyella tabacisoli TaxID=2282381 RepID=A0A369UGN6_9GAMM|nr:hypothetical protein DVJ77_20870 [Dyella tabacisoli]
MPRGITQEQVSAAANALVSAGDKPTVEKIRQALGTGSPNTVTRMLDTWRGTLAQHLQEVIRLPNVPPEAGQAFAEVWRLAVAHAETFARTALTEEQNSLLAAQSDLTQERKLWEIAWPKRSPTRPSTPLNGRRPTYSSANARCWWSNWKRSGAICCSNATACRPSLSSKMLN